MGSTIEALEANQREANNAYLREVSRQRNLQAELAQQQTEEEEEVEEWPVRSGKTTKLPDPELLSDDKNPSFEAWSLAILDKLAGNADHFPNTALRLAYVRGWMTGRAREHLMARS